MNFLEGRRNHLMCDYPQFVVLQFSGKNTNNKWTRLTDLWQTLMFSTFTLFYFCWWCKVTLAGPKTKTLNCQSLEL